MKRLLLVAVAGVWLAACGENGSTASGDTTTSTTSTGGGGAGGSTTSAGGATPTGVCGRRCTTDDECCPVGVSGCPGPYPVNYRCVSANSTGEKACRPPECMSDVDCEANGLVGHVCKIASNAIGTCVQACAMDADCSGSTMCIGVTADGTKYCRIDSAPFMCAAEGGQCDGLGSCAPSGDKCVCTDDDECDDAKYTRDCIIADE